MTNMPKSYTPTVILDTVQRPHVAYGIGLPKSTGLVSEVSMMYGPFPNLRPCLEQPAVDSAVIVRFNIDRTDEIIWRYQDNQWHPQPGVSHSDYEEEMAHSNQRNLTPDDLRSIAYFSIERDDPTRWVGWEEKSSLVRIHYPDFYEAWQARESAQQAFIRAANALTESLGGDLP